MPYLHSQLLTEKEHAQRFLENSLVVDYTRIFDVADADRAEYLAREITVCIADRDFHTAAQYTRKLAGLLLALRQ